MTRAPDTPPLSFSGVADVARALRERGGRVSGPTRVVLAALFSAPGPVSAERLAATAGGLDMTTVYRNLERLEELGVVRHVHLGHGPGLYALVGGEDREYLVCDLCDRVEVVDPARLDGVRSAIREEFGYEARFRHFAIHGVCAPCARALPDRSRGGRMSTGEHPHDEPHTHEHTHHGETHEHPHDAHDHEHVEHEHEHSHGDVVHAHEHVHEEGLEEDHRHSH